MPALRRRNSSSLFESSTVITANLIMASSSYLLSKITPRAPATQPAPAPPARSAAEVPAAMFPAIPTTLSVVQPAGPAGRRIVMQPDEGEDVEAVDELADIFIKKFRETTRSDLARMEESAPPATGTAAPWQPPPPPPPAMAASKWAGTVRGYRSYHR